MERKNGPLLESLLLFLVADGEKIKEYKLHYE